MQAWAVLSSVKLVGSLSDTAGRVVAVFLEHWDSDVSSVGGASGVVELVR